MIEDAEPRARDMAVACAMSPASLPGKCCGFCCIFASIILYDAKMQLLSALRGQSGISMAELARRAGINRSTLHRIEAGTVSPKLSTLQELALAAGLELDIQARTLSAPAAMRAARHMLEEPLTDPPDEVEAWVERLIRWYGDDPVRLVRGAGEAADLHHRSGVIELASAEHVDELKLASAASASEANWALSGTAALERLSGHGSGSSEASPLVLHTADPARVAKMLAHARRARRLDSSRVLLVPMEPGIEEGTHADGPILLVAPIQALLDGFALGGSAATAAQGIAESW